MNEVKIIKRFCKNYNYHDLNLQKIKKYKNELIIMSKEIAKESEKIPLPVFILLNHYEPKFKKYDYLSDSKSFCYLTSKKYDKKIYLFGDLHNNEGLCGNTRANSITSDDFINEMIKNSDVYIDVFIEHTPEIEPKKFFEVNNAKKYEEYNWVKRAAQKGFQLPKQYNNSLQRFRKKFSKCYWSLKKCEYPNLRAHAFDIRQLSGFFLDYFIEDVDNYLSYDKSKHDPNYKEKLKEHVLNSNKIMKQLNMIDDKSIKEKIINYMMLYVDTVSLDQRYYIDTLMFISDIYLLGRMFKTFDTKNSLQPNKSKNIILYAGDSHTQNIIDFLVNELNFKVNEIFPNVNTQCINISKLKIPYFRD